MGTVAYEEAVNVLVLHRRPKPRDQAFFRETCREYCPDLNIRNTPNGKRFRDVTHVTPVGRLRTLWAFDTATRRGHTTVTLLWY